MDQAARGMEKRFFKVIHTKAQGIEIEPGFGHVQKQACFEAGVVGISSKVKGMASIDGNPWVA